MAGDLMAAKSPAWRNAKHRAQWRMTLEVYAGALNDKLVDEITTEDVLAVLQPIWSTKPETASRTRGRIEAVLDAAHARGFIASGTANPARWRGHLDHLLPKRDKLSRRHHAALAWEELPAHMHHTLADTEYAVVSPVSNTVLFNIAASKTAQNCEASKLL